MQDAKEDVRSKLDIEDVIGEYVKLKRAGRNFKGLSPFTSEKSPSFFVSPDKNIWHDFSSNKGGDIFTFIMEVEGMDFRQSLEYLANKAGVDLSQYESSHNKDRTKQKNRMLEANRLASVFFQQSLLKNEHSIDYVFKKRQLSKQVVTEFMIGYAPDSGSALSEMLQKRGFSKTEISDAGLSNRFGGDMFKRRMMVSLMDATGRVIGFTGRIIQDEVNSPKYLNTSQTLIYDKSRHVFGLSQAKESIRDSGYVVIVEGNLDVISSHQAGIKQVVATAGTAMTIYHLKSLKRLVSDIRLAYDNDSAGITATERAIDIASDLDIDLSIISIPSKYKDPDECIKNSVDEWELAINNTTPAVEWIINQYKNRVDINTAKGKRQFTTASLNIIKKLNDPVEQEYYEKLLAEISGSTLEAIRLKIKPLEQNEVSLKAVKTPLSKTINNGYLYEDDLLAIGAIDTACQELFEHTKIEYFHGLERQALAKYYTQSNKSIFKKIPEELQKYETYVNIVLLRAEERYSNMDSNELYYEAARLLRRIEHENKKQTQNDLIEDLRIAESNDDESNANIIRKKLNDLIKEIARGKR